MANYLFNTKVTLNRKEDIRRGWYIDENYVRPISVNNDKGVKDALKEYVKIVQEKYDINISESALKNKEPMYVDINGRPKQVGYIIVGSTEMTDEKDVYRKKYISLWIQISMLNDPF